jgi:high-affinity iron transporter
MRSGRLRPAFMACLGIAGLLVLAVLVWQGVTAGGNPNPSSSHLDHSAVILDTAILVLREGLEAILVLAALTASFVGEQASYRRPVAGGVGVALLATVATWFIAVAVLDAISAPALDIQAATGLLAIVVLLVVMNWFFHKIYWTGWISHHNKRRKTLLTTGSSRIRLGLGLLGFSAMYREGFEVVLFLQTLRLQAGTTVVLEGVILGSAFTAVVGALTFALHHKLPYKKMLIVTGVMLGFVLVVMTGESVQEMQLAGWIPSHSIGMTIPSWAGVWFAVFPNIEGLAAQALAAVAVIGSYVVAEDMRVRRPKRRRQTATA